MGGQQSFRETFAQGGSLLQGGPLFNRERAEKVLKEESLAGLIVAEPLNVFHLTGYWPQLGKMGFAAPSMALLSADPKKPVALVMPQFLHYYVYADAHFSGDVEPWLYTHRAVSGTAIEGDYDESATGALHVYRDKGDVPMGELELHRRAAVEAVTQRHGVSAEREFTMVKAARALDMTGGRIGVDHMAIMAMLESSPLSAVAVPADNTLRKIRLVKSPREIELMRLAAQANAEAALAAVGTVREGATTQELRAAFFSEAAARGNAGVFMAIDRMITEVADFEFSDGAAFFVDCVSSGWHYHGDFARTIFLGEPAAAMRDATRAMHIGWEAIRERLRPGLRYSEIPPIGQKAVRTAGLDFDIPFSPHSVGLTHTDEPGQHGRPYWVKDDLTLEPGMILSVDCPVLNTGMGGSAHMEDLSLITADGAEPIHTITDPVIIV
ncbi:MAG: M24 family metallopeptidase [Gammaproteobacteria bacterium]|nr:M24 family metallopeptidase [Gammaproteobacteria bacterium]MYF57567.1 M24 family metallopeptidase [Gammaproteobacteria bacterium]